MKLASDQTRKQWVIRLQRMLHPETGAIIETAFQAEQRRYEKAIRKHAVDGDIGVCSRCSLMSCSRACGWGDLNARYMFIGQSLHEPGAQSGLPFALGSGYLIDAALRLVGLDRHDVFLTNAVHCHPERNAPGTPEQLNACLPYLAEEISIVEPDMILCLGNDAKGSVTKIAERHTLTGKIGGKDGPIVACLIHPAAVLRGSPEATKEWVLRTARELERI